ncbi:hypothetical protein [Limnohabitans sp. 2KL-27]|nr:hypothetical protein [Limnohabitans sp. 2KL-27]
MNKSPTIRFILAKTTMDPKAENPYDGSLVAYFGPNIGPVLESACWAQ